MAVIPITTAPALIDAGLVQFITAFNCFAGPFSEGGALYGALEDGSTGQLQVVKSVDSGATWARVDDGAGATPQAAGMLPVFGATGQLIFVFIALDSGGSPDASFIDAQAVVYASGLFDALVADPTADPTGTGATFGVARADDSILMVYPLTGGGSDSSAFASVFAAGAFGVAFLIDPGVGLTIHPAGVALDESDIAHVVTVDETTPETHYFTIDAGNTISGPVVIPDFDSSSAVLNQPVANGGLLAFPYADSAPEPRIFALIATGATSNPSDAAWSIVPVSSGMEVTSQDSSPYAIMDGADLLVFWVNATDAGIFRIYYARFNGSTFDAPVVFYDSSLHPPVASVTGTPVINGISITTLAGQWVAIATMNINANPFFSAYYLTSSTGPTSGYRNRVY